MGFKALPVKKPTGRGGAQCTPPFPGTDRAKESLQ